MPDKKAQLEYIQSANRNILELLVRIAQTSLSEIKKLTLTALTGSLTRLLWALDDGLDPSNAAAFVECVSNIYEYATTNTGTLDHETLLLFKQLTSKKHLRSFLELARNYDASTLESIVENDRYCLFSVTLLKDARITTTLGEEGLTFARQALFQHLDYLKRHNPSEHRKPIARLVATCQLKCIHRHQKLGDYGFWLFFRDFFGYHTSSSYDKVGTLVSKCKCDSGRLMIPHYLGRQPTIAMLARLAKNSLNLNPIDLTTKILLISIQAPHEGYGTDGKLKKFFHWFAGRTPVVTAENVPENVTRLSLPILDHSMNISPQELMKFLQGVKREVDSEKYSVVYTNCRGGKARSSGIAALIKVFCNNITLAAAFDEVKKGRSGAKRFEGLKSEQADVIIRTYFKSLIAENKKDADAQARLTALTNAQPDIIAKHLKWYLERANLQASDGGTPPTTSCDNFWKVMQALAQDQAKFLAVMSTLLPSLSEKGRGQLMVAIKLNPPYHDDHLATVKLRVLMDTQIIFKKRLAMKPAKRTLLRLRSLGGEIFDTAVELFKPSENTQVMEARKEVFLARPETLVFKTQTTENTSTQQIELELGALVEESPDTINSVAQVRAADAAPAVANISGVAHDTARKADHLMSVSLRRGRLSEQDKKTVLAQLKKPDSGLVLLKSGHDVYHAYLIENNTSVEIKPLKHRPSAAFKGLFPEEQGKMCQHTLGRIGGSHAIHIPVEIRSC